VYLRAVASAAPILDQLPAKPFLKWVGGKRQLLVEIEKRLPESYSGRYFEPFLGGGALFFHLTNSARLAPKTAVLADTNERLVRAYQGVRDDVDGVLKLLSTYQKKNSKKFFYEMRARDIDAEDRDAEVAAWLVYLNRTGYNGLYRVNSKNRFNVPFGRYANPGIHDPETLRRCADALSVADMRLEDFEKATASAKKNDLVYFDPPYVPLSATSSFASYTSGGFDRSEQKRLRDVALSLKKKGVRVLLSNSSAKVVWDLYEKHFVIKEVQATRLVNSKASRRGAVTEVLIY
jgi:DNA adenine methylase